MEYRTMYARHRTAAGLTQEKAAELLGWKAEYNIEDMCRDSYNWQLKNPKGYDAE